MTFDLISGLHMQLQTWHPPLWLCTHAKYYVKSGLTNVLKNANKTKNMHLFSIRIANYTGWPDYFSFSNVRGSNEQFYINFFSHLYSYLPIPTFIVNILLQKLNYVKHFQYSVIKHNSILYTSCVKISEKFLVYYTIYSLFNLKGSKLKVTKNEFRLKHVFK